MIVIDASALAKLILKEQGWESVMPYIHEGIISIDQIAKEATNAIGNRFKEAAISLGQSKLMFDALMKIVGSVVKLVSEMDYLEEASRIMLQRDIAIYDALYIALAKQMKLKLLTADQFQAKTAASENVETILLE